MSVHTTSGPRPSPADRRRLAERLLLLGGVGLLAAFCVVTLHARIGQAYASWSFDRALAGESATTSAYVEHLAGWDREPPGEPKHPDLVLASQMDDATTSEWSAQRVKAFEEAELAAGRRPPVGRLEIPSIDLAVTILEGTDDVTLNRAVGTIEGTARPGEVGNVGIAGHRDGWFRPLRHLLPGEIIVLRTLDARYEYRVEDIEIVGPDETHVLDPTDRPSLTLVTCYPFYWLGSAPQRYIVKAELVSAVR